MIPSQACYDLIKRFEGCELTAYPDPGTGGAPWTIGYGYTFGIHQGMTISQEQAEAWLIDAVLGAAAIVSGSVKVPLNQQQFDALTSFVYNIGRGLPGKRDGFVTLKDGQPSTMLRALNAGNYGLAASQFVMWIKGGNGQVLPGLVTRRNAERQLFVSAVNETPQTESA